MSWLLSVQNISTIASHAIFAAKGAVAGCSEVIEVGLCATTLSSAAVYSAKLGLFELHTRNTHLVENMIVQTRVGHGLLDKRPHGAASVGISCEIRRHSSFCRIRCKRTYMSPSTPPPLKNTSDAFNLTLSYRQLFKVSAWFPTRYTLIKQSVGLRYIYSKP
jgi:hypothetical protein